jgi:hypothetical protein
MLGNGALLTGVITSVANINSGTSNVTVVSSGGNVTVGIGGTGNVAVFASTGEYVTGLVSATGNITGSYFLGNGSALTGIDATSIQNGTSNVKVVSSGGNVTVSVGGTGNVAVFSTSGMSVTANITGGNLISAALVQGVTVSASGNVIGGNVNTNTLTGTGVTIGSSGNINLSASGNIVLSTQTYINNLSTPVQNSDAATKQYVDDIAQGLHTHDSCNAATTGTLATISSGTVTYDNGTAGVGATLTTTGTYTTIDGVTLSNGMRILVKNEVDTARNGIYDRTSTTVLTRSTDFDTPTEMAGGDFTFVTAGTLYDNTGWVMTEPVTTVGTSPVPWVQFSGAGTYTAGTGLTLNGSEFSVNTSQTQVTAVGTLGSLAVTANITGGNLLTGGFVSATGNITGGNVSGTSIVGTLTTAAQTNITSVGTLTGLTINNATTAITNGGTTGVGNIGATGATFNTVFAKATTAQYADLAEKYVADAEYPPGTVLVFGGSAEVTVANSPGDTRIAGVVSTNPGFVMNEGLEAQHVATVALTGRVPTKVTGLVSKGDMMVTAGNGHAHACASPVVGTVIGKALENFDGESGVIEVVVGVR